MRSRQILMGAQVALGTILLASAGLLLHSFVNVMGADRGYQVERVMAVDLSLFGPRQNPVAFYEQLAGNLRSIPGVQAAGVINGLPATAGESGASRTIFHPTDRDFQNIALQRPVAMIRGVSDGYFAASGTPLRAGRYFTAHEPGLAAIISESLAKRLWPADSPDAAVGRSIRQGDVSGPLIPIVGVVQDVRAGSAERALPPFIYRPFPQWANGSVSLVLRAAQDAVTLAPAIRAEIRKLNPNLPIPTIRTMREIVSESVSQRRFQLLLTAMFGWIALLLAAVGVFGVVSYAVACRTREIGLRIALGATSGSVLRWVFRRGMMPVFAGLAAGVFGTVATADLLRGLLYGVTPFDVPSLTGVVVVVLTAAGLACYLPSRRASRLDPMTALRCD